MKADGKRTPNARWCWRQPSGSCWLSSLLRCKSVHLDAALGGATVILNRDLRVENGLFISIICFLDGGLS